MKATDLKTLVAHYIEDRRLLDKSRLQLAALSGGADSVALLMLLPIAYWVNSICVAVIVLTTIYSGVEYFTKNLDVLSDVK